MSNNCEVKSKKALFLNGKQITDYIYDFITLYKLKGFIAAGNFLGEFALYDYADGKLLFKAEHHSGYFINIRNCITLAVEDSGTKFFGVISFKGEILVPFKFAYVESTEYDKIFEVETFKSEKGYYMTKTNQLIVADDIKKANGVEYDFLIDNKWKRYSFISDIYTCIN